MGVECRKVKGSKNSMGRQQGYKKLCKARRGQCSESINPFQVIENLRLRKKSRSLNKKQEDTDSFRKRKDATNEIISNNKRQKLEKKKEKDEYNSALKKIDEAWKEVKFLDAKSTPAGHGDSEDINSYDVSKNELKFERMRCVVGANFKSSTEDNYTLKVLSNIKDLNLDTVLEKHADAEYMNSLVQDLHFLAKKNKFDTANQILDILDEEHEIFTYFKQCNMKKNFPRGQTVALLNIIGQIYSTTELHHPVVSPALIFLADILGSKFHPSYNNILTRLLLCGILLHYLSKSKKFMPEVFIFLKSCLQLAQPGIAGKNPGSTKSKAFDLVITEKISSEEIPSLTLYPGDKTWTSEEKKIGILYSLITQVSRFAYLYNEYPLFTIIFQPLLTISLQLPLHLYQTKIQDDVQKLMEVLRKEMPPLRPLSFVPTKPKPLKMFEPAFECKYGSIEEYESQLNSDNNNDVKKEHKAQYKQLTSLKKKIRKEERGLLRDIRKSAKAAAAVKLEAKLEMDKERERKTKQIYSQLAAQEGEFKKINRKN